MLHWDCREGALELCAEPGLAGTGGSGSSDPLGQALGLLLPHAAQAEPAGPWLCAWAGAAGFGAVSGRDLLGTPHVLRFSLLELDSWEASWKPFSLPGPMFPGNIISDPISVSVPFLLFPMLELHFPFSVSCCQCLFLLLCLPLSFCFFLLASGWCPAPGACWASACGSLRH